MHFTFSMNTKDKTAAFKPLVPNTVKKAYVLLVEDSSIAMRFAESVLKTVSCEIEIAKTGLEALALTEKKQYDFMLIDLELPDLNGNKVTQVIREREAPLSRRTPIIGLTAHAAAEEKTKSIIAGMHNVYEKPFNIEIAQKLLNTFVANHTVSRIDNASNTAQISPNSQEKLFNLSPVFIDINYVKKLSPNAVSWLQKMLPGSITRMHHACTAFDSAYSKGEWNLLDELVRHTQDAASSCGMSRLEDAGAHFLRYVHHDKSMLREALYCQLLITMQDTTQSAAAWLQIH